MRTVLVRKDSNQIPGALMINKAEAKAFVNKILVDELARTLMVLTIADLGIKAKQTDVAKVKKMIKERIAKLKPPEPKELP